MSLHGWRLEVNVTVHIFDASEAGFEFLSCRQIRVVLRCGLAVRDIYQHSRLPSHLSDLKPSPLPHPQTSEDIITKSAHLTYAYKTSYQQRVSRNSPPYTICQSINTRNVIPQKVTTINNNKYREAKVFAATSGKDQQIVLG